jgi:hypothetical protein
MLDENRGALFCNQCFDKKNGDGFAALQWLLGVDFQTAAEKLAQHLGVKPLKGKGKKDADPEKDLEWRDWAPGLVPHFLQNRPGITEEAVVAAGARMANYKGASVIAFPVIGQDLDVEKPVGWTLMNVMGGMLPKYSPKGDVIGQVKVKIAYGSKPGLIGLAGIERILAGGMVDVAYKVEGVSDLLALQSRLGDSRHVAVTNAAGAGEKPKWMADVLAKVEDCRIVHDCDEVGQAGASTWCQEIAIRGGTARNFELPYEVTKDSGKDLRDYFQDGHDLADLELLAEKATPVVMQKTADGELDYAKVEFPLQDLILKKLQIEVLLEDEKRQVQIFSKFLKKSSWVTAVTKIQVDDMLQIAGVPAQIHISSDPDGINTFSLADVKNAIALAGSKRRGRDGDQRGVGVWQGRDEDGEPTDAIVLVGGTEAARWNGTFSRVTSPHSDGLVLDLGTREEWFDYRTIRQHLKSAENLEWRREVVKQATDFFDMWRWENQELDPALMTGLVLATWVQSVWDWRPLVSITGDTNTGKSLLFEGMGGTMGRNGIFGHLSFRQSKSTEAGVRQGVKNTAKVILSDEFERSGDRDKILELFRASTRGEAVARGTADHKGRQFTLRHICWVAAIETGLQRTPDLNRFVQMELLPAEEGKKGMLRLPEGTMLYELGQKLLAIAVRVVLEAKQRAVILKSAQLEGIDARTVECYSVPAAMLALSVGLDEKRSKALLVDLLGNVNLDEQNQSDHGDLIIDILESTIFCSSSVGHRTVWQILESGALYYEHSEQLAAAGVRKMRDGSVFIAVRKVERQLLRNTRWHGQRISQVLRRAPNAKECIQRIAGSRLRGISLMLDDVHFNNDDSFKESERDDEL